MVHICIFSKLACIGRKSFVYLLEVHVLAAVMQFSRLVMSEKVIRRLLKQDVIISIDISDPNCKRTLYESGRPATYFILVIEGHVQIHIGSEDFVFDGGPFMYFGAHALTGNVNNNNNYYYYY